MNEGSTVLLFKAMCMIMYIYAAAAIMSCFPRLELAGAKKLKPQHGTSQAGDASDDPTPPRRA